MDKLEISFGSPLKIIHVAETAAEGFSLLTITFDQFTITAEGDVMYTLPIDHAVKMHVSYVDAHGNPATVDGPVIWASSDDDIVKLERDLDDTTICVVAAAGTVGNAQVTATADADLGEGVRQLITTCDISVVAGEAVAGNITPVDAPTPIAPEQRP
jgi:hypothetical protein